MNNIARLTAQDRSDLFRNTADKMGLSDAIVEKDFWVCFYSIICFIVPSGKMRLLSKAVPVFQRLII